MLRFSVTVVVAMEWAEALARAALGEPEIWGTTDGSAVHGATSEVGNQISCAGNLPAAPLGNNVKKPSRRSTSLRNRAKIKELLTITQGNQGAIKHAAENARYLSSPYHRPPNSLILSQTNSGFATLDQTGSGLKSTRMR
jgi:hypothetical protein